MTNEQSSTLKRRDFLRTLGASAATTAVPLSVEALADGETNDEKRRARYKADSPHVQTYYHLNRYPMKK